MKNSHPYYGICAFIAFLCISDTAYAWGPAAHLHFGAQILANLGELSFEVRALLAANPIVYLYGCVSADVVLAKKMGKAMTHCHRWDNGLLLLDHAQTDRQKVFALGYLSHLAADCVSHNCYVPSKIVESYESGVLKHVYWEMRFDKEVTNERTLNLFKEIAEGDYEDCDALFENLIPMRVLDFSFNKKLFNRLLLIQGLSKWQKMLVLMQEQSKIQLSSESVHSFSHRAIHAMKDFLNAQSQAEITLYDPKGDDRLAYSHELRKLLKSNVIHASEVRGLIQGLEKLPF